MQADWAEVTSSANKTDQLVDNPLNHDSTSIYWLSIVVVVNGLSKFPMTVHSS